MNDQATIPELRLKPIVTEKPTVGTALRCSLCAAADATQVCAACGRFRCANCSGRLRLWARVKRSADIVDVDRRRSAFVYCPEHASRQVSPTMLAGAGLLALGLLHWALSRSDAAWWWGAAAAAAVFQRERLDGWIDRLLGLRSALPRAVFSSFAIGIHEEMKVDFALDPQRASYLELGPIAGRFSVSMREHAAKTPEEPAGGGDRSTAAALLLHAGFVAVGGTRPMLADKGSVVAGPLGARAHALIGPAPPGYGTGLRRAVGKVWRYRCEPPAPEERALGDEWRAPLRVFLHAEGSRFNARTFALEVQCSPAITKAVVDELIVHVPAELESVTDSDGVVDREQRRVTWADLRVAPGSSAIVRLEFARPVSEAPRITAQYAATVDGYLASGLHWQRSMIWAPTGRRLEASDVVEERTTRLFGAIDVATQLLPKFQEVVVRRELDLGGVDLNIDNAHRIILQLARRDLYAKHVVVATDGDGSETNYYEVVGRQYVGNQPFDVNLLLADGPKSAGGGGAVSVSVQVVVRVESQLDRVADDTRDAQALADDLMATLQETNAEVVA